MAPGLAGDGAALFVQCGELLLQHGDVFGAGLVVSPSVWWAGEAIVARGAVASARGCPGLRCGR